MVVFAILLPTVDPVSLLFETIPLLILFEASIWLSRLMERTVEPRIRRLDVRATDDSGPRRP